MQGCLSRACGLQQHHQPWRLKPPALPRQPRQGQQPPRPAQQLFLCQLRHPCRQRQQYRYPHRGRLQWPLPKRCPPRLCSLDTLRSPAATMRRRPWPHQRRLCSLDTLRSPAATMRRRPWPHQRRRHRHRQGSHQPPWLPPCQRPCWRLPRRPRPRPRPRPHLCQSLQPRMASERQIAPRCSRGRSSRSLIWMMGNSISMKC